MGKSLDRKKDVKKPTKKQKEKDAKKLAGLPTTAPQPKPK